jgi:hypothetical protein
MFFKKTTPLESDEYKKVLKLVAELEHSVTSLSLKLDTISSQQKKFEGRFYQHIRTDGDEEEPTSRKELNTPLNPFRI